MPPRGGSKSQSAGAGTAASAPASRAPAGEASAATNAPTAEQQPAPEARFPLFYRSLTPLDVARHGGKSLKRRIGYDFARSSHAVLLNGSEFEAASPFYPI